LRNSKKTPAENKTDFPKHSSQKPNPGKNKGVKSPDKKDGKGPNFKDEWGFEV